MKYTVTHTDGTTEVIDAGTIAEAKLAAEQAATRYGKSVQEVKEKAPPAKAPVVHEEK